MKYLILLLSILVQTVSFAQCPTSPGNGCDGSGTSLELYWVGTTAINSGNWNEPCSWRVGSTAGVEPCQAPRSIDNVYFTNASFSGGQPVITINALAKCNDFIVSPTVNALVFTPKFNIVNPANIEVYGDFSLQNNINWDIVGGNATGPELLFKSGVAGNKISTSGHTMGAVQFDGVGGEWALQDEFNAGSLNFVFGYLNTSDGTTDHDMNLLTFDSDTRSGGTAANRRIDLNSSVITLTGWASLDRYPYNTTNAPYTVWECRGTSSTHLNFNAATSKIIFTTNSPFLRLGGLTYNVINHTGTGRFYDHFGPEPCNIDTMETNGYLYFHHTHSFNVLKINSVAKTHNFFRNQKINTDLIVSGNICNPTVFKSEYNRVLTMPASVSADPMNGFEINNLRCVDGTFGHVVNGYSQGNTVGWTITPPVARDLYWVGGSNGNWNNPINWSTSNTGVPLLLASDCPPIQTDNVFFISPLADGDIIFIDQASYCHDQTWDINVPATFSGSNVMNVYGNLQLDSDINFATTSSFQFWGNNNQTVFSAGKSFIRTVYFWDGSNYTLLDDLDCRGLYLQRQQKFSSGGHDINGTIIYFRAGATDFSGSTITMSYYRPWYVRGAQGVMTYDNNSHVIATNTSAITEISGWGNYPHLPKFTLQSPNTTLRFRDHFKNRAVRFDGDVTLNGSAIFRANSGAGTANGSLKSLSITGDLILNPGKTYSFNVTNPITVTGDLIAQGTCNEYISISGVNGPTFGMNVAGTATLDFCNISDFISVNPHNATNSFDAGSNSNITFTPTPSLTYYWRAKAGTCPACVYNGDWASTTGYWTTNSASVMGMPGCIPGPNDNVVFDNKSFLGATTASVSITSSVSCHNLDVIGSNIRFAGNGNLKVTGSLTSDGTLKPSPFSGKIEFISSNPVGESIDFGGIVLLCDVLFANPAGSWSLLNSLSTTKKLTLQSGSLFTNGENMSANSFDSNGSSPRTLNLGNSTFNIVGSGNFVAPNSPANRYTWNTKTTTNFNFIAGTSTINFTSSDEPTIRSWSLAMNKVNFTATGSIVSSSPVLEIYAWSTKYMKFSGSGRIYGDNIYDTLHFSPGKIYVLQSGKTQTFRAPNGVLLATGTAGNGITVQATVSGSPSVFRKFNTGGLMSSFCLDYISVQDNNAISDDPSFKFFAGINSNNISGTGLWDFSSPLFVTPSIDSGGNQSVCKGAATNLSWNITGSGPYKLTYTTNGINPVTTLIPDGSSTFSQSVSPMVDTEYKIVSFAGRNCNLFTDGVIADYTQFMFVPSPAPLAINNDQATCNLSNGNKFVEFQESVNGTERPLVAVLDKTVGIGLGSITATIKTNPWVESLNGIPYLQRRYGITPTNNEGAIIRLYFTQGELDALSTAWGAPLTLADLGVTKYDNNTMSFGSPYELVIPTSTGSIPAGITTSPNVLYLEIDVTSFSHFVIHPIIQGPLPIELLHFSATLRGDEVALDWRTATEIDNDFFTIERSIDGKVWEEVYSTTGAGNSTEEIDYVAVDRFPLYGDSYYRLKQTDFDGQYSYSQTESVRYVVEDIMTVMLYPNPAKDNIFIEGSRNDLQVLQVFNMQGQDVTGLVQFDYVAGEKINMDISRLAIGLYSVRTLTQAATFVKG